MFESFVWIIAIGTPSKKHWSDNVRWEIRKDQTQHYFEEDQGGCRGFVVHLNLNNN
jgi:hypothetical protein